MEPPDRTGRIWRAVLLGILAVYAYVVLANLSRSVGGSDSSGYFNAARAISSGKSLERIEALDRLHLPPERDRLFIPLGYLPGHVPGTMATFYPMGLPIHAALLALILGWGLGPFLVSPLAAVLSLLLVYLTARELSLTRGASVAAAAMFAASPILTYEAVQLMSDTLATAWALAAVLFGLKSRRRAAWAAAAGLAFGIGVLVRPTSAILLVPLLFAIVPSPRAWTLFAAGGIPPALAFLGFNRAVYGGALRTGYGVGGVSSDFALANFPARARHYAYWISIMMSRVILPGWAAVAADRLRPLRIRLLLLTWFGVFLLFFGFYGVYDAWWYTRFLLPGMPALVLAAAMVGQDLLEWARRRPGPAARRIAAAALALSFAAILFAGLRLHRRYDLLDVAKGEAVFPETIEWARKRVPERSLVLAMQFSGAMKAYGWGTPVRWDWFAPGQFEPFRAHVEARGYRFYALLFPYELKEAAPLLPKGWRYLGSNRDATLWELPPLERAVP